MKEINRKMRGTVRQMRDLPLNIALKEDFVMILLFNFRQKPWYFYEIEDSKEREEMGSIQSTKFERWLNMKSKTLHHFLDIVRYGTSYSVDVPRDMVMVYKSLIYRHLSFERPGSFCVDHSPREVQTQLRTLTDTTNWNLSAYLYMALWRNFPGEYCGSKYVKVTVIP